VVDKFHAELADRVIEHLMRPEVQAELRARQRAIDAYYRWRRKAMTPTHEQLHRPFTI